MRQMTICNVKCELRENDPQFLCSSPQLYRAFSSFSSLLWVDVPQLFCFFFCLFSLINLVSSRKTYKSCIYPSVLHFLLSRLTFVPGASSVNPRSAGTRSSSVSTFNLKSAVIHDHNNTVN